MGCEQEVVCYKVVGQRPYWQLCDDSCVKGVGVLVCLCTGVGVLVLVCWCAGVLVCWYFNTLVY